ncbi:hypothetical protein BTVI_26157 [Pitangus sulphuratus]|nr:hypothetical protein BTVI_26157 [Pitangus sulphuratus]
MMKELEYLSYEERLRELGLKGGCKEDRPRLFSLVPCDRTRGNGHKLTLGRFPLNTRKRLFNREARLAIVKTLEEFDFGRAEKCVRINSVSSGLAEEDLEVLLQSKTLPSSMMLPKVENAEEIRWGKNLCKSFCMFPDDRFWNLGYPTGSSELAVNWSHGKNWQALVFKELNFLFKAFLGATSSKETHDILYARQKIIVTAKAFGLQAIDLVYIDFHDEDGLRRQSREGASMGFTGKQVIHPNQIAVVQEQFSPSPEKIKWAQELISAFEEHQRLGKSPLGLLVLLVHPKTPFGSQNWMSFTGNRMEAFLLTLGCSAVNVIKAVLSSTHTSLEFSEVKLAEGCDADDYANRESLAARASCDSEHRHHRVHIHHEKSMNCGDNPSSQPG